MELEVRVVGIESCFVSLPVTLLQALESTTASVKVVSNLPKATMVTIEPDTEDDWEVLELNAEHAEQAILKQVAIVYGAMRFPLWLHGQTIITFKVVSTFPLTPAKRNISSGEESMMQDDELLVSKALLRVQDTDDQCIHKYEAEGVEMSHILFEPLQTVVIIPRETKKNHETKSRRGKSSVTSKEGNVGVLPDKHDIHQAMVRLIFSESVAKGHIMLPRSIRLYLRAELHSCVYVKRFNVKLKKEIPLVSLSPCEFKIFQETGVSEENNAEALRKNNNSKTLTTLLRTNSDIEMGTSDWSIHEKIAAAFSYESSKEDKETSIKSDIKKDLAAILHRWCLAQLHAVTIKAGVEVKSLILGNTTLLHFKAKDSRSIKHGVQTMNGGETSLDAMYVLSTTDDSLRDETIDAYEVAFDEGSKLTTSPKSFEPWLGKLQLGNSLSIRTVREKLFAKCTSLTTSSLDWMGTAAPDVINRLVVLLSSASWMLSSAYDFPLPGHILIYGPSVSSFFLVPFDVFGKTLLATVAAKFAEESEDILAHIIVAASESEVSQPSSSSAVLAEYFADIMDEYEEKRRNTCDWPSCIYCFAHVVPYKVISFRSCFFATCSDETLLDIASKCDGYDDVGGLNDIRNAIIELLRMRSNVLVIWPWLWQNTHCHAAAACSLRFISASVRDIFSKSSVQHYALFFDEFDSIALKRGQSSRNWTKQRYGVPVFVATSRPDLLDAALLRPGRLDRLLFCDFPSQRERSEILSVLSRKLPLASDVDLDVVARLTEGFSGADLQALLSDAQLEAVHDLLDSENAGKPDKKPVISDTLLKSIASKAKSSVSDAEKQRLYDIYHQFLDSKRSVAAQSRDAKGKRATLA
ncbi:hypothetical protein R3W88_012269 [Solanum pinnatisectum]|uniref:Peroxisomal ATPase PEX1 n=1 Tax=Solanum pinnatisectum TaxID=50273 RepID=A0AAV9L8K3_9SOLN|nr:hypothetical protein R3W88_012269 [Solanum pinnatisectum]